VNKKLSTFIIQAIKKTKVKSISKAAHFKLINSSVPFQKKWNSLLEMLILQQLEREIDLLTSLPIERYKRFLERSTQLFQEIPNKYIADYLRMTPETLSRIKKS
jgi:CRP-like cAMP-binding protein